MNAERFSQVFLSVTLPQILVLEDGTEVRISVVEPITLPSSRLTLKLEFDLCIVFVSVRLDSAGTYGLLVPVINRAIASLRLAVAALHSQFEVGVAEADV